ncbi:hypothetical protein HB852_01340 [Listeria grandensis]|nr:hypothetical protein [Listeria grandensis]MBC1473261.1 hypothetical protein [Listeria grandensis]
MDFIHDRETTFPTFLKLTVATHDMCERMEATNKAYLLEGFHREKLERTSEKCVDYQLNGFSIWNWRCTIKSRRAFGIVSLFATIGSVFVLMMSNIIFQVIVPIYIG